MGQTADQLRQEIEQKREDAASKIDQIESRVQDIPQMAKETVTDTVQQAKDTVTDTVQQAKESVTQTVQQVTENFDVRQQIEQRPLAALGAAVAGGFLLGGMMRGGKGGQQASHGGQSHGGEAPGGLRRVAKDSGLEETLSGFAGALMGMLTERVRSTVEQSFPQVAERMQSPPSRPQGTGIGQSGGGMLPSATGAAPASPATTDASGRPATQLGGSELRG